VKYGEEGYLGEIGEDEEDCEDEEGEEGDGEEAGTAERVEPGMGEEVVQALAGVRQVCWRDLRSGFTLMG
jgi:hypothetical protein